MEKNSVMKEIQSESARIVHAKTSAPSNPKQPSGARDMREMPKSIPPKTAPKSPEPAKETDRQDPKTPEEPAKSRKQHRKDSKLTKKLLALSCVCSAVLGAALALLVQQTVFYFEQEATRPTVEPSPTHSFSAPVSGPYDYAQLPNSWPKYGETFGRIDIDSQDIHMDLNLGTDMENLKGHASMFSESVWPGQEGTTVIAGHAMPQFGRIYKMQVGDKFTVSVPWGKYEYQVIDSHIEAADTYPLDAKLAEKHTYKAILYSCYPLNVLHPPDRSFVEAELRSGPIFK